MDQEKKKNEHFFITLFKPLPSTVRKTIIDDLESSIRSQFDYFLLAFLASCIATLGLITNSPSVIIGAMLLAPLMTPIIAIGMASNTEGRRLFKQAAIALVLGCLLAVLVSILITYVNRKLPFIILDGFSAEIKARTRPTPIDLLIALTGGTAAAYALTHPKLSAALPGVAIATALMPPLCTVGIGIASGDLAVAGGASLLFLTNAVAITFASGLVFFLSGFSMFRRNGENKVPKDIYITALLVAAVLIFLSVFSIRFVREAEEKRKANEAIVSEVNKLASVQLVNASINEEAGTLNVLITVQTGIPLAHFQVVELQKVLVEKLNRPVSIKVDQILVRQLDPLQPPTNTPTPTLGPSSTPTQASTSTLTPSPTPTETQTPTSTKRPTETLTPTPAAAIVQKLEIPSLLLYQTPNGPVIGYLRIGESIKVLTGVEWVKEIKWVEVMDKDGRRGWVPVYYLNMQP
ncbi:MAG: DUF389 domain-containing protein [Anaerolineaceae bacterium]|nr:DUF389 domain-containing protein [Anaerolineaceae bacterium]